MIATPAYGGLISTGYFTSILRLMSNPEVRKKYQVEVFTISNDALIPRARQECVKTALDHRCDRLLFVDADIIFTPEDFLMVLDSNKPVIGGTYRKKCPEPIFNFNVKEDTERHVREKFGDRVSSNSIKGMKELQNLSDNGILEVTHIPTGFMCIDISVIIELAKVVPNYVTDRRSNHKLEYNAMEIQKYLVPELFPVRVNNNILESEDWGFCRLCKENNIPVYLHTDVIVDHIANLSLGHSLTDN